MQGIEQFVVAWRHFQTGQDPPTNILGPVGRRGFADQHQRQVLVPIAQLPEQLDRPARATYLTEHDAENGTTGFERIHHITPFAAGARQMIFTEEIEDDCQITATVKVIVYQQNLGFTPHLVYRL